MSGKGPYETVADKLKEMTADRDRALAQLAARGRANEALESELATAQRTIEEQKAIIAGQVSQLAHLTEQRTTLRRANGELTALLVEEREQVEAKADAATAKE